MIVLSCWIMERRMSESFCVALSSKDAGARITSIVEDYGTAKYNSVVAGLLKNSPLVLPK